MSTLFEEQTNLLLSSAENMFPDVDKRLRYFAECLIIKSNKTLEVHQQLVNSLVAQYKLLNSIQDLERKLANIKKVSKFGKYDFSDKNGSRKDKNED